MAESAAPGSIDVLMITHDRPHYTGMALERLLRSCDETMRVWVWQNGMDEETWRAVESFRGHPRLHRVERSAENKKLNEPTNWLWKSSRGDFVGKVDDDCLVPLEWARTLRRAHGDVPRFGVIGCWSFPEEDFDPGIGGKKVFPFEGHRLMRNCWVGGSGYLMKRRCVEEGGLLRPGQSFTDYCLRLAGRGWINGWYFPFLYQEHLDDPRFPGTLLKTDEDIRRHMPLSASANGVTTIAEWSAQLKRSSLLVQKASFDPRHHLGWRRLAFRAKVAVKKMLGIRRHW